MISVQIKIRACFRLSNIFPMSDFDEEIDEEIDAKTYGNDFIEEGEAGIGYGNIETSNLGPCLCLLLDFMVGDEPTCYLHHYDSEMTDPHVPPPQLLENYLRMICDNLKFLGIKSLAPVSENEPGITNTLLVVYGGDVDGRRPAKEAFSLLNQKKVMFKSTSDTDLSYLYRQLAHHTIIFESVSKSLSDDEESNG